MGRPSNSSKEKTLKTISMCYFSIEYNELYYIRYMTSVNYDPHISIVPTYLDLPMPPIITQPT